MKACTKCGETKPLTEFYSHKLTKDGLSVWCKECHRNNYQEYMKTASGVYTSIKGRLTYYKTKPLIIDREDFIKWYNSEPKICVYCDIPEEKLKRLGDSYNNKAHRLTVDCVENDLGYISGNLVLACLRCNSIKSDFFSHEEMRALSQQFIKPKWMAILDE